MQQCQGDLRHGRRCAWSSKQTETAFVGQARFKDFSSLPPNGIVRITASAAPPFLLLMAAVSSRFGDGSFTASQLYSTREVKAGSGSGSEASLMAAMRRLPRWLRRALMTSHRPSRLPIVGMEIIAVSETTKPSVDERNPDYSGTLIGFAVVGLTARNSPRYNAPDGNALADRAWRTRGVLRRLLLPWTQAPPPQQACLHAAELCLNLGDGAGVDQVSAFWWPVSMPSVNLTPVITFGN
jgi:hypothetical protein